MIDKLLLLVRYFLHLNSFGKMLFESFVRYVLSHKTFISISRIIVTWVSCAFHEAFP